ncbi:MAG: hypothetical protein K2K92_02385 [Duncaniella sp.]|nr:hypothetical protein [Duncaniella sp.]
MKIIRVVGDDLDFHPDSSLITGSNPFFFPDFGGEWVGDLYMAVHINRLGKSISAKFAPRYYDGIALALHFRPADIEAIRPGTLSGIDSTFAIGTWTAPAEAPGLSATADDGTTISLDILPAEKLNEAIARVSQYTTLRMGDIILIPYPGARPFAVGPHSRITAGNLIDIRIV